MASIVSQRINNKIRSHTPKRQIAKTYGPIAIGAKALPGAHARAYSAIYKNVDTTPHPGLSDEQVRKYRNQIRKGMRAANMDIINNPEKYKHSNKAKGEANKLRYMYRSAWDAVRDDLMKEDNVAGVEWVSKLGIPVIWHITFELREAIRHKALKLIRHFVHEKGADINFCRDALTAALRTADHDVIELVISLGAQENDENRSEEIMPLYVLHCGSVNHKVDLEDRTIQLVLDKVQSPCPSNTGLLRAVGERMLRLTLTKWGIVGQAQENYVRARGLPDYLADPKYRELKTQLLQQVTNNAIPTEDMHNQLAAHALEYYRHMPPPTEKHIAFYERLVAEGEDQWPWVNYKEDPEEQEKQWEFMRRLRQDRKSRPLVRD